MNEKRVVAIGRYSIECIALDIDPTFGTDDEWRQAMSTVVDAAPELTPWERECITEPWPGEEYFIPERLQGAPVDERTIDYIEAQADESYHRWGIW